MVPESTCQVAEDREDMGTEQYHGGVRIVRCHGPTLAPSTGHYIEERQRRRDEFVCTLATE